MPTSTSAGTSTTRRSTRAVVKKVVKAGTPTLREERRLLREGGHRLLAAVDEVGRGALAGPVSVGVVVVHEQTRTAPAGVRDSKLLTADARGRLVPRLRRWAPAHAVGHASAAEIDRFGIIAALRLAARRALATLPEAPDCVLLDGNHDWLSVREVQPVLAAPPQEEVLFEMEPVPVVLDLRDPAARELPDLPGEFAAPVVTRIKADLRCAAVAAASVLAKVERDGIMTGLAQVHPEYSWELNKGYSAPDHIEALRRHGASPLHRRSWSLPGTGHAELPFDDELEVEFAE